MEVQVAVYEICQINRVARRHGQQVEALATTGPIFQVIIKKHNANSTSIPSIYIYTIYFQLNPMLQENQITDGVQVEKNQKDYISG